MTFVTIIETFTDTPDQIFKIKKGFAPLVMRSILKGRNNT